METSDNVASSAGQLGDEGDSSLTSVITTTGAGRAKEEEEASGSEPIENDPILSEETEKETKKVTPRKQKKSEATVEQSGGSSTIPVLDSAADRSSCETLKDVGTATVVEVKKKDDFTVPCASCKTNMRQLDHDLSDELVTKLTNRSVPWYCKRCRRCTVCEEDDRLFVSFCS